MVLLKHGESLQFSSSDIKPAELIENDPFVMEQFKKIANNLKKIAPRANDFLYFSAAMMHSAERSLYNDDGTIKKDANGNPVEAHWEINENTGSWKWVCSDPNVKPYKNCFIPGTKITMEDGSVKNIEDVVAGEKVISHTGKAQKVLRTFVTPHNGEILELYVSNNKPITCTTEHPFYILRNETKDSSLNRVLKNKKYSLLFTEGNKIKEKDSFLQPIVNKVVESKLSEKKARILGLYAAEGCTKEYETIFSLGSHEKEMAKEYIELINDEYPDCSAHINKSETQPTKLTISVYGKSLREDCDKHVENLSYAKKLSKEIVFGIKEIKENFIIGWMEGDGHVDKESGKLVGTTTSPHLANQTRIMLNSLGINSSLYKEKPAAPSQLKDGRIITGKHDIYRVKISRNNSKDLIKTSNKLHFEKEVKDRKPISFIDNYQILQYLGSDKKHYEGNVYNLEVENDNSYIADGIATHNCNLDIFPEQELKKAYKKWVGKPLCKDHQSSSIDGVRGIILDTYYDDKAKQVVALCALDKVNYGPLARAVEAGYANSVSMGTAVGKSICTECGNVARVESEYCEHVRGRKAYGEINVDLAPIELSLVVNGADPLARVRTIIAQTQNIEETLKKSGGLTSVDDLMSIKQDFSALAFRIGELERELVVKDDNNFALKAVAQNNATQEEFNNGLALIKNKMANVESMIQTIANRFNTEELMSNINKAAYYNGTEEPTPGKPQYAKEEADKIRDNEDRQMKNVADTGPVDGLFPGDLEQKKMIARAKTEERRQLRAQAVAKAKTAYIQGTTEPTKYPVDPLAEKARKEDKQMNVQDVGKGVLMPGDEETKKKLLRAKLKARFVKAASPDQNRWDILNGDTVILSATFNEITGGRPSLFSSVKTAEFAKEMMKTIKEQGVDGAAKFYKAAQMPMDPMAGGMPGMGGDMGAGAGGAMPAPVDPLAGDMGADPMMDMGMEGDGTALEGVPETVADPVERGNVALEVLEKNVTTFSTNVQELMAEIKAGYETLSSQGGQIAAAGGGEAAAALAAPEQTVTASLKALKLGATGPESTKALRNIQVVLNAGLKDAFKKTAEELEAVKDELDAIKSTLGMPGIDSVNQDFVNSLASDAITEAKAVIAKSNALKEAFIKYARGAYGLEKKAAIENRMLKLATKNINNIKEEAKKDKDAKKDKFTKAVAPPAQNPTAKKEEVKPGETKESKASDQTIEDKKMYRQKLAAKAMQMSEMLGKAHPSGSTSIGGFDYKSSEAVVEDLVDTHNKMEQVATTDPKVSEKTKKAAERLDGLIKAGKVNADELDGLVAHGLDSAAVAYWKKYFGQVEGGGEFAGELVKEYSNEKRASVDVEQYKVKLASAYDLAYEMAEVGLIENNRQAIKNEVESIVKWTDEAFSSMKRVIAHHRPNMKKEASLEVGIAFDSNVTSGAKADNSMLGELTEMFSNRNYLGRK